MKDDTEQRSAMALSSLRISFKAIPTAPLEIQREDFSFLY